MDAATLDLVLKGLALAAWLALPIIAAGLLAGLISSVLQAVTGWQDAALSQVPKLLAVALVLAVSGSWMAEALVAFARVVWSTPL